MTAKTGRTSTKWCRFNVDDSAGTLRTIPVDSINGIGLDYDTLESTSFMDTIKTSLPTIANCTITISGPFDTTAAQTAGTMSGSHTVLYNLPGGATPLSLNIEFGMRQTFESGEPTFGLTSTAANGFLCRSYKVDPSTGKYTAEFYVATGSAIPAWGTTPLT